MIATMDTGSPKVVGIRFTGKLNDEDYTQFMQAMETILTAEGKVRLFVEFDDFPGWDVYAAWDDFKLNLTHPPDFERIAMVGDRKWEELMASFCQPFTKATVKYFDSSEVDAAWKWLLEGDEANRATEENDLTSNMADTNDRSITFPAFGV